MTMPFEPPLLAGPPLGNGPKRPEAHRARVGALPPLTGRQDVTSVVEASGLLGRGAAGFPVGRKWRAVAEYSPGDAVLVVNGAKSEPRSAKDRALNIGSRAVLGAPGEGRDGRAGGRVAPGAAPA
jgi:hypothetical protein